MLCDDLESCSYNDTCVLGECTGTSYSCDDGLVCTSMIYCIVAGKPVDDTCIGDGNCTYETSEDYVVIDGLCYTVGDENVANKCVVYVYYILNSYGKLDTCSRFTNMDCKR